MESNNKKAIHKLPTGVINFIAAGEIVERPSSIVKELIENSIDSEAKRITLSLDCEKSGEIIIKIEDDGKGIGEMDLVDLFKKHHTSKAWDLNSIININTMGFRGEALWSIGNVSQVTLITQQHHITKFIQCKYGEITPVEEYVFPFNRGTTIEVKNIFHNLPARKKFLRSFSTEYQHIINIFNHEAHCNPTIGFILKNNNNVVLHYSPVNTKYMRLKQILGEQWNEDFTSQVSLDDYHCEAIISYEKSGKFLLAINGRPFSDFKISNFLKTEIKKLFLSKINSLQGNMHISGGLWLNIPPEDLELNVHPRKTQVRFRDTHCFYALLKQVVVEAKFTDIYPNHASPSSTYALNDNLETDKEEKIVNHNFPKEKKILKNREKSPIQLPFKFHKLLKNSVDLAEKIPENIEQINTDMQGSYREFKENFISLSIPYQGINRQFMLIKKENQSLLFIDIDKYMEKENRDNSNINPSYSSKMFISKIIGLGAENITKLSKMSMEGYPIKFSVISGDSIIAWEIPREYNKSVSEFFEELKSYLMNTENPHTEEFLKKIIFKTEGINSTEYIMDQANYCDKGAVNKLYLKEDCNILWKKIEKIDEQEMEILKKEEILFSFNL